MENTNLASNSAGPVLSNAEFSRIAQKVKHNTGIVLKDHKSVMVQARISRRLRELGYPDFASYIDFLDGPHGHSELTNFCNAITINLTSFFREPHHFEHFEAELRHLRAQKKSELRIWSAGCSTGEEPHCISLVANNVSDANIKILATDLDTDVLAKGRGGVYTLDKQDGIPSKYRQFLETPDLEGHFTFTDSVRDVITFNRLNLLEKWPFQNKFDVIFCRNVLIYFDTRTKMHLVDRFADALRLGGVLYLGHSETILEEHARLASEGRTTYRKTK